jgi:hypothetical protein
MTALSPTFPRASRRAFGSAVDAAVFMVRGRARLLPLNAGCLAAALFLAVAAVGAAEPVRQQTVQLRKGWNAVFLEVAPLEPEPAKVFAGTPVDIAAAFHGPLTSAQFMTDPGANLFRLAGWSVWYAESRPDAFLKSLHAINGQQGYLLHARQDFTLSVTGLVSPAAVRWQADAFNYVGFSVDAVTAPTFARFFGGSPAHNHNRIYRLENGVWRQATNPAAEVMRSGEAFWIFCAGTSDYQGPLRVEAGSRAGLALGSARDTVVLRNQTSHPVGVTMDHVAAGGDPVPMAVVVLAVGDTNAPVRSIASPQPDGAWSQPIPAIEAGQAVRVPLQLRQEAMKSARQVSLLKFSTDVGTVVWIPVYGFRRDLD